MFSKTLKAILYMDLKGIHHPHTGFTPAGLYSVIVQLCTPCGIRHPNTVRTPAGLYLLYGHFKVTGLLPRDFIHSNVQSPEPCCRPPKVAPALNPHSFDTHAAY
jgi:hypothetical protein